MMPPRVGPAASAAGSRGSSSPGIAGSERAPAVPDGLCLVVGVVVGVSIVRPRCSTSCTLRYCRGAVGNASFLPPRCSSASVPATASLRRHPRAGVVLVQVLVRRRHHLPARTFDEGERIVAAGSARQMRTAAREGEGGEGVGWGPAGFGGVRVGRPRAARESKARDGGAGATSRGAEATVRRKRVRAWAGSCAADHSSWMHRRDRRSGSHDSGTGGGRRSPPDSRQRHHRTRFRRSRKRDATTRTRPSRESRARRNLRRPLRRAGKEHARTRVRPRDHARAFRAPSVSVTRFRRVSLIQSRPSGSKPFRT